MTECYDPNAKESVAPELPIPPQAKDVNVEITHDSIRTARFTIASSAEEILLFYDEKLKSAGWHFHKNYAGGAMYGYTSGPNNPAFRITIKITSTDSGVLTVTVKQVLSGPFSTKWS